MQETQVWSLGGEDPLEEEMATHSNILAWEIPWTKEPGGYSPRGITRVGHDWASQLLGSLSLHFIHAGEGLSVAQGHEVDTHLSELSHVMGCPWPGPLRQLHNTADDSRSGSAAPRGLQSPHCLLIPPQTWGRKSGHLSGWRPPPTPAHLARPAGRSERSRSLGAVPLFY